MNFLILGRGKTGSLVAEVARARRHHVRVLSAAENSHACALTPDSLAPVDVVIDFTTPTAAVANAEACIRAKKHIVVGATGWYDQVPRLREMVLSAKTGFLYGSNFSIGVNLFFEIVATAGAALKYDYQGQIFERHHENKRCSLGNRAHDQKIVRDSGGEHLFCSRDNVLALLSSSVAVSKNKLMENSIEKPVAGVSRRRAVLRHDIASSRGCRPSALAAQLELVTSANPA